MLFGQRAATPLKPFAGRETRAPIDQHYLLALVAPRGLLLLNAFDDPYSNVESADQTFLASREVFDFLRFPNRIGLHLRAGGHSFESDDWRALLDFADEQFRGKLRPPHFDGLEPHAAPLQFNWRAP